MESTLQEVYGVNLDDSWNRRVTESWDKAQTQVRIKVLNALCMTSAVRKDFICDYFLFIINFINNIIEILALCWPLAPLGNKQNCIIYIHTDQGPGMTFAAF